MKRNDSLQYTHEDANDYYYVYDIPVTNLCGEEYAGDLASDWYGDKNPNRYRYYTAKITGRDANREEIREYIKNTRDGMYVGNIKVGDIIKINEWDSRKSRGQSDYMLIVEKTEDVLRFVFESTYLKCKKLSTLGYTLQEVQMVEKS